MKKSILYLICFMSITAIVVSACKMTYKPEQVQYAVHHDRADIQEGKRLTMMMCGVCHYDNETKQLTGVQMVDVPDVLGTIIASNITQHPTAGIGNYTDAELAYVVRTGVARDGRLIPFMQKPNIADEDLRNIIAFLRSDDPLVQPSEINPGNTKYSTVGKMAIGSSKPYSWTNGEIKKPNPSDKLAFGKYMVDNLACYDCHSKSFAKLNKVNIEKSKGFMGGGNKMMDKAGNKVLTPNLTPHETGIGNWTEAEFARTITNGINKDMNPVTYPMPLYPELTETEISAIFAYLQSIPPIKNEVKKK